MIMIEKLTFDFQGHHFEGEKVAVGLGIAGGALGLYGLRKFFAGGWCGIEKDLSGEIAVITGGNTGIGKETARRLANLGCDIIIGARDQKKNEQTVKELSKSAKGKLFQLKLDLCDRNSIKKFVEEVKGLLAGRPLNYLINNAGIMAIPERKVTSYGVQMQLGVNHFGHFELTYLLWKDLKMASSPRIINVSSSAHQSFGEGSDIDFNDFKFDNGYAPWKAYSRSKKANILFSMELQRRMDRANIGGTTISLHPGAVRTQLLREYVNTLPKKMIFWIFGSPFYYLMFKNMEQGAQTTLYGILEREEKLKKGCFYADCKPGRITAKQCEDAEAAQELWKATQKVLGFTFDV